MVRPIPNHVIQNFSAIPLAIGLFVSVSLLVALCAKHARKNSSKTSDHEPNTPCNKSPLRPLPSPKQLITTISHKAMMPIVDHAKKLGLDGFNKKEKEKSGLWQKAILMGEKCQPLDYSGVIFYDYAGNRVSEMPKSPKASPLRNFNLPMEKR